MCINILLLTSKFVHFLRHGQIQLRHPASIMGIQRDFNPVVNIEPFGMVIHLFGQQGGTRHERPRLAEIFKLERFCNGRTILRQRPARKILKPLLQRFFRKFLRHCHHSRFVVKFA